MALAGLVFVGWGIDQANAEKSRSRSGGAAACINLSPRDAVVAVCLQNDFMDAREADGSYVGSSPKVAKEVPQDVVTDGGKILKRGALAVSKGHEVVGIANEWLKRGSAGGSRLMVTMDWHPKDHCSFCKLGKKGKQTLDCVWGCEGTQGLCVTGASVPKEVFDSSNRCLDEISSNDYAQSRYFQWPPHCVEGTFGAELDPFLHVPAGTVTLKSSSARDKDSYSMFHSIDESSGRSMEAILKDENIKRVFIMGLATDMVVKNTLWDILAAQNATKSEAVLIAAGARVVFDEPGDYWKDIAHDDSDQTRSTD